MFYPKRKATKAEKERFFKISEKNKLSMANKRLQKVELLKVTREIEGRRKNLDTETQDNGK